MLGDEYFDGTLQLIREKAAFSRWRTLKVDVHDGSSGEAPIPWSSIDAFTHLESLEFVNGTCTDILGVIDRTITARLEVLDLRTWPDIMDARIMKYLFGRSPISHMQSLPWNYGTQNFPANIANPQLDYGKQHCLSHIRTYELKECPFYRGTGVDLRSVTLLIVRGELIIQSNCHVFLPALRELKLRAVLMNIGAKIEAPVLDVLCFINESVSGCAVDCEVELLSHTKCH
jgi:hypothetical protein